MCCLTLAISTFCLSLVVMFLQRRMIYFPTRLTPAEEATSRHKMVFSVAKSGGQIIGWELPAKAPTAGRF